MVDIPSTTAPAESSVILFLAHETAETLGDNVLFNQALEELEHLGPATLANFEVTGDWSLSSSPGSTLEGFLVYFRREYMSPAIHWFETEVSTASGPVLVYCMQALGHRSEASLVESEAFSE